ncbi:PLP-dependent aminotransferase family protein [Methylobacterium oryzisoli]|uniref:MocR-like pyridoxine biosynthesis transcription factor PdxR n=1 Tax=Methylobacterium oryzisoli TaxID=3385502 RepID=UPI00389181CC
MDQSTAAPSAARPASVGARICAALKAQIAQGVYGPGARLPSTRALAAELGVSRTTVTAAYEQLIAEGYLETRQGARARVAPGLAVRAAEPDGPPPLRSAPRLSAFGRRLIAASVPFWPAPDRPVADFRYGDLAGADFPALAWRRALDGALVRRPARLAYADPRGLPELRSALQGYLWRARGLRCAPEQIVVVNGSQQALDLCARLLLDPGDGVVIEDPCYGAARQAFAAAGARLLPVAVDQDGLRTAALAGLGPARLAYVTPSHQFPLGGVMAVSRRQDLLAWAQATGAMIVEDDYDGEYRYDTRPIEALQSLDRAGVVVYVGTVSKTLSPQLRLGYMVVPPALADILAAAKRVADRHTPGPEQAALARILADGAYERHVRRARRRNGERRTALLAALAETLGDRVSVAGAAAGLHVVAWFPRLPAAREAELVAAAHAAGIGVYPVSPLYDPAAGGPSQAGLVLGYASADPATIRAGIARLAAVVGQIEAALPAERPA